MRETLDLIKKEGGNVVGFVVALDRVEKMPSEGEKRGEEDDGSPRGSAMGQIRKEYGVQTSSIVTLDDLIALLREKGDQGEVKKMEDYRSKYVASD